MINYLKGKFGKPQEKKEIEEKQYAKRYTQFAQLLMGRLFNSDETYDTAADILSMKIAKNIGQYYHDDEEIQAFVRENIEKMKGSLMLCTAEMAKDAFLHGFSGTEIVWEPRNGRIWTKELIVLDSMVSSYDREKEEYDFDMTRIPTEKMIIYIRKTAKHDKIARLQAIKTQFLQYWAMYIESFIAPLLIGKGDNPEKLGELLGDGFGFLKQICVGTNESVEAIQLDKGGSDEIQKAMEYIDKLIYRTFYIGSVLKDGESAGGRATSGTQKEILDEIAEWIADELKEVLLEQWIRKLITYNFEADNFGRFEISKQKTLDMNTVKILSDLGFLKVEDEEYIREQTGLKTK